LASHAAEIRELHRAGVSKSEIARRLHFGRTSVLRIWPNQFPAEIGSWALTQAYRNLTIQQAVNGGLATPFRTVMTEREREVRYLIAEGPKTKAIAGQP
jgi:hypothetical protein